MESEHECFSSSSSRLDAMGKDRPHRAFRTRSSLLPEEKKNGGKLDATPSHSPLKRVYSKDLRGCPLDLQHDPATVGGWLSPVALSWRIRLWCLGGLLVVILAAHGIALWDGVFFDDHWHRFTLTHYGWGWSDLVESTTFNLPGYSNLWWQIAPMEWRYARPLCMLLMKVQHIVTGGDPFWIHAFGLLWAWLCTSLVFELALFAGLSVGWSLFAGLVFIINPHSVMAVSWNACRNVMMGDFFLLACVVIYARASFPRADLTQARFRLRLLAVIGLWVMGLFIRESAIILPALLFTLDLSFGGWIHLRSRLLFHIMMIGLDMVFLVWRMKIFTLNHISPPKIYFIFEPGWNYLSWSLSKLMQLVFCHIVATPPVGGLATHRGVFWLQHAPEYTVMAGAIILTFLLYAILSRGQRGRWYWMMWTLIFMLPFVPLSLLPYFLYTSFAGKGIMLGIVLSRLRRGWVKRLLTLAFLGGTLYAFLTYQFLCRGIVRAEQMYYQDTFMQTPGPRPGDTVFFINQSIINLYAPLPMREHYGFQDLHGWVLTLADHHIMMRQPSTVDQINDHELLLATPEPGFFSGIAGQFLLEETRPKNPLREGSAVHTPHFDVTVLEDNPLGYTRLKFSFQKPLNSPDYHFYFSSPQRPAYRLDFNPRPPAVLSAETRRRFEAARSFDPEVRRRARHELAQQAGPLTVQLGSHLQFTLAEDHNLASDKLLDQLETWWRKVDADRLIHERQEWLVRSASLRLARNHYYLIQNHFRSLIKSDLIQTGPRTDPYEEMDQWPWKDK
jgi:hypothetical protein